MTATAVFRAVRELGFNARRLSLVGQLPRFIRDLREWRRHGGKVTSIYPVLSDWQDQAGSASGAYFHQDLLVARKIFAARPSRHIDVGSRIDGFVAHVAVFREIEVLDIRPVTSSIRNMRFLQADMMKNVETLRACTDSLSCLHALEHFGLGRYSDPIDPRGHFKGFQSLINMLQPGGTLYLSFPIGVPVVEFNAHRVFGPAEVLTWPGADALELKAFDFIDDAGKLYENVGMSEIDARCSGLQHGCGVYTFSRRG